MVLEVAYMCGKNSGYLTEISKLNEQAHAENINLSDTIQKTPGMEFVALQSSCIATNIHLLFLCSSSLPLLLKLQNRLMPTPDRGTLSRDF